jgi:transcriptional regulator with XRE-family HTH domain
MDTLSVLKKRRQELNMTQAEVAKAAGISQPTYQNYEAGTITIPPANVKKLARALKMTKEEILGKPKVVALPPIIPRVPVTEHDGDDEDDFHPELHQANIAIHFAKGEPIVLAISECEYLRLYSAVQEHGDFFTVYSMSNQIVGVRRAAVTDLSFAHEAGDTFGLEHEYYRENRLITGVWPGTEKTWHIIEALTDPVDDTGILPVVERYGRTRVDRLAARFRTDILENVHEPVAGERLEPEDGQYSDEEMEVATKLACYVKWQLSNGKVRQEHMIDRNELVGFSWLIEDGPAGETFFRPNDDVAIWINANTWDYISVPAHSFLDEYNKETDSYQLAAGKAATKKKKSG